MWSSRVSLFNKKLRSPFLNFVRNIIYTRTHFVNSKWQTQDCRWLESFYDSRWGHYDVTSGGTVSLLVESKALLVITHVVQSPARITDVVVRLPQSFIYFDFQSSDISNIFFTSHEKVSPKNNIKGSQSNDRLINQSINQTQLFICTSYEVKQILLLWDSK